MTIFWDADDPDFVWVNEQRIPVEMLDLVLRGH